MRKHLSNMYLYLYLQVCPVFTSYHVTNRLQFACDSCPSKRKFHKEFRVFGVPDSSIRWIVPFRIITDHLYDDMTIFSHFCGKLEKNNETNSPENVSHF